jgi:DNA-binding HxlR family transcriptional regulator
VTTIPQPLEHSVSAVAAAFEPCPMTPVVDMIFSRWTAPILRSLHQEGPLRFGEIRDRLGAVTPKVLTQRLRQLERDGLITRESSTPSPNWDCPSARRSSFSSLGARRTCRWSRSPATVTTSPDAPARPEP